MLLTSYGSLDGDRLSRRQRPSPKVDNVVRRKWLLPHVSNNCDRALFNPDDFLHIPCRGRVFATAAQRLPIEGCRASTCQFTSQCPVSLTIPWAAFSREASRGGR